MTLSSISSNPLAAFNQLSSGNLGTTLSGAVSGTSLGSAISGLASNATGAGSTGGSVVSPASSNDLRIRLSPLPNAAATIYGSSSPLTAGSGAGVAVPGATPNSSAQQSTTGGATTGNILSPLQATGGLLFPYSPQIQFSQAVDYSKTDMSQTNMDYYTYARTPSVTISITGKFTVQSAAEGAYALAAVHFLRVVSKMYFGTKAVASGKAGLPPPVLMLSGYGNYMFGATGKGLRVILKTHSFSYEESMDTVLISTAGGLARLPALFSISCELTVQQTPANMKNNFDLDAFRTGQLMLQGGWI